MNDEIAKLADATAGLALQTNEQVQEQGRKVAELERRATSASGLADRLAAIERLVPFRIRPRRRWQELAEYDERTAELEAIVLRELAAAEAAETIATEHELSDEGG
jgi:hypothetical protein